MSLTDDRLRAEEQRRPPHAGRDDGAVTTALVPDPLLNYPISMPDMLFDQMPMGIVILDRNLRLRRFNSTWAGFIGRYTRSWASQVVPGVGFFDLAPGTEPVAAPIFERVLAGETMRLDGLRIESGGIVSYWDAALTPLIVDGQVIGILNVTTDATERVLAYQTLERRVEERTREIEQRRQVAEGLRDLLAILNSNRPPAEMLDSIVAQACRLIGADAGAIFRLQPDAALLTIQAACGLPDDYVAGTAIPVGQGPVGRAVASVQPVAAPDLRVMLARRAPRLDPADRACLAYLARRYRGLLAVPLIVNDAVYGALVLYYRGRREFSSEEIALTVTFGDQAALAIENAQLRDQVGQMAVASERSRLARDLHDSVTQTLFSASLIAEVLPRLWQRSPKEGQRRLEELRLLTRGALAEMRTLLLELRPATLIEVGLADLLHQLAEAITGRTRVPVALTVEGQPDLPPDVQIALYRIAQEALNNVAKHAGASYVSVDLRCRPDGVDLRIGDDGRGFNQGAVSPEHLGLGIMRERADAIGAVLCVESRPGHGTQVAVSWSRGDRYAARSVDGGGLAGAAASKPSPSAKIDIVDHQPSPEEGRDVYDRV